MSENMQATVGDYVSLQRGTTYKSKEKNIILNLLEALDDKIELNQQMNHTLEAIARALFKSWFINFDPVRAKVEQTLARVT